YCGSGFWTKEAIVDSTQSMPQARAGSGAMFNGIARRYDLVNRVISLGVDQRWRNRTVSALPVADDYRVLDLATGTADLAIMAAKRHPGVTVVGTDPSEGMLAIGESRVAREGLGERVKLVVGEAERISFPDQSFDAVIMAFGIRNVPDRVAALREMARVTRDGGRVAILELSEPRSGF